MNVWQKRINTKLKVSESRSHKAYQQCKLKQKRMVGLRDWETLQDSRSSLRIEIWGKRTGKGLSLKDMVGPRDAVIKMSLRGCFYQCKVARGPGQ